MHEFEPDRVTLDRHTVYRHMFDRL